MVKALAWDLTDLGSVQLSAVMWPVSSWGKLLTLSQAPWLCFTMVLGCNTYTWSFLWFCVKKLQPHLPLCITMEVETIFILVRQEWQVFGAWTIFSFGSFLQKVQLSEMFCLQQCHQKRDYWCSVQLISLSSNKGILAKLTWEILLLPCWYLTKKGAQK